jgi:hypothetical protein
VVNGQQTFKLVHLDFEHFELVGEEFLEAFFHEVLEQPITVLFVFALNEQVPCDVVHALAVADLLVSVRV